MGGAGAETRKGRNQLLCSSEEIPSSDIFGIIGNERASCDLHAVPIDCARRFIHLEPHEDAEQVVVTKIIIDVHFDWVERTRERVRHAIEFCDPWERYLEPPDFQSTVSFLLGLGVKEKKHLSVW
jgi:hypothetical protein